MLPETIRSLIECAKCIPTGGNRHANELTVITGQEARRALMVELSSRRFEAGDDPVFHGGAGDRARIVLRHAGTGRSACRPWTKCMRS